MNSKIFYFCYNVLAMRVESGKNYAVSKKGAKKLNTGEGFSLDISDAQADVQATANMNATASVGSLETLISIQDVAYDAHSNKRAYEQGELLLERLENLRLAILSGSLSASILQSVVGSLPKDIDSVADKNLRALMKDIDLRASVEIAKYEMRKS